MNFSKLLYQSLFDNVPNWPKQQTENCYQPCIKYKIPPCPSQPRFLPQQFPPYYDDVDPNSLTKYREWPTSCKPLTCTIESFEIEKNDNMTTLFIIILIAILVLVCIVLK